MAESNCVNGYMRGCDKTPNKTAWRQIFILDNAGLFGLSDPSEISFTFHPVRFRYRTGGVNLFGLSGLQE